MLQETGELVREFCGQFITRDEVFSDEWFIGWWGSKCVEPHLPIGDVGTVIVMLTEGLQWMICYREVWMECSDIVEKLSHHRGGRSRLIVPRTLALVADVEELLGGE